nr:hypothetical protein CFP56_11785 [Quercus suber]
MVVVLVIAVLPSEICPLSRRHSRRASVPISAMQLPHRQTPQLPPLLELKSSVLGLYPASTVQAPEFLLAALHGIVLAAVHVDGKLCTALSCSLMGRLMASDSSGSPVTTEVDDFPYGISCNLTCDPLVGPFSSIRGGSANNIYVIPAPEFNFNTATLICGGCCIPAILLLVSMWFKILEVNLKKESSSSSTHETEDRGSIETTRGSGTGSDEMIGVIPQPESTSSEKSQETNDQERVEQTPAIAEQTEVKHSNRTAMYIRRWGEIVIFGAAGLGILLGGEKNLFSSQLQYEQEPIEAMSLENAIAEGRSSPDGDDTFMRRTARILIRFNQIFLKLASNFDDKDFREGDATGYPQIPGESWRNDDLSRTISNYSPSVHRSSHDISSPTLERQRSPEPAVSIEEPRRKRRDTLEVPSVSTPKPLPTHEPLSPSASATEEAVSRPESPGTPTIVISADPSPAVARNSASRRHTVDR